MGQALAAAGYITPTSRAPVPTQPLEAVQAIRLFVGPVPTVLLLLSILFAWFYSITRQYHHELVQDLAERTS
jgi:GPH family glycoside/pentoside/hexuronide:cation symporter